MQVEYLTSQQIADEKTKLSTQQLLSLSDEKLREEIYKKDKYDPSYGNSILIDVLLNQELSLIELEDLALRIIEQDKEHQIINLHDSVSPDCHNTPLVLAIKRGFYNIADKLIDGGVDINAETGQDAQTALHFCMALLGTKHQQSDINQINKENQTLFELTKKLIQNGANPNKSDNDGRTPKNMLNTNFNSDSFNVYSFKDPQGAICYSISKRLQIPYQDVKLIITTNNINPDYLDNDYLDMMDDIEALKNEYNQGMEILRNKGYTLSVIQEAISLEQEFQFQGIANSHFTQENIAKNLSPFNSLSEIKELVDKGIMISHNNIQPKQVDGINFGLMDKIYWHRDISDYSHEFCEHRTNYLETTNPDIRKSLNTLISQVIVSKYKEQLSSFVSEEKNKENSSVVFFNGCNQNQ